MTAPRSSGHIEIELPSGARVRVHGRVEPRALAEVLTALASTMIALPAGVRVWLAAGATDMRKGFDGLAGLVQTQLLEDPFSGQLFVFRGRRGDRVKILWWDGDGLCLFAKRLERGRFIWPQATHGTVSLDRGAALDAARGHRLAASGAELRAAGSRGVSDA